MSLAPIPRHHVGNVGTVFRRTVVDQAGNPVDLTNLSTVTYRFERPSNNGTPSDRIDKLGGVVGDPLLGVVEYTSDVGLMDRPGRWQLQLFATFPGSVAFAATAYEFIVEETIPTP